MNLTAQHLDNIANSPSGTQCLMAIAARLDGLTAAGFANYGSRPLDGQAVEASRESTAAKLLGKSLETPALSATAKAKPASPATP